MLKAGRFGTWTLDLADRRLVASDICKENFGRNVTDPFSYPELLEAIFPEDRARMEATVAESIGNGIDYDIEYRVVTPSREIRWVQIRGKTFYRADGTPLSMAGVSIDITARKRGEEHRALLAGELNHRVKNSMATMQSIAYQTFRSAGSLEEARKSLESRLQSMAVAHDVLTRENWEGATMAEVVDNALLPFRTKSGSLISTVGPDLRLNPRSSIAFAMALHELATNAAKYGALSGDIGRVIVNWEIVTGNGADQVELRWEEIGGPPVKPPTRTGFGSRMIERILNAEIGG